MGNASNKAGTNNSSVSNNGGGRNNSSMSNSTISSTNKSTSSNSAISSTMDSMSSNTVGNSHFWGGNNTGGNNLGVMANNTRAMSGLGAYLFTLGGDGLFAVFSDGGVNNFVMFGVANLSWGFNGSILANFLGDRATHWGRNSSWGNSSVSISISISFSFSISLSSNEEGLGGCNTEKDSKKSHFEDLEAV